jgi:hypothetical protein
MKNTIRPQSLLEQAAQIQRMERGKFSVMRQGPKGSYFKLQTWEKGKNVSRYIPTSQAPAYQEAVQGYQEYQQLIEQHAQHIIDRTRADIAAGRKKKRTRGGGGLGPRCRTPTVDPPLERPARQRGRRPAMGTVGAGGCF